jgi:hypothetical protein
MVEVGQYQINEVRQWLGFRFDEVARWRESKAVDFPDDARNTRSASSLHGAANYVRTVDPVNSPGLIQVTRIVETAHQSEVDLLRPTFAQAPFPGVETQRVAGRFGFDNLPGEPDRMAYEEFLQELAEAMVRDLREQRLFELEKDSPLAKLLRTDATPMTPEVASLVALTELVDEIRAARADDVRSRRYDSIAGISDLVVKVRDVAIAEAASDGSLQRSLGTPTTYPQARLQLRVGVKSYVADTGRELPACMDLATGSTMTGVMSVVGAATSALEELDREVETV